MRPSRSMACASPVTCGSSARLPLVITTGRSMRRRIRRCSGVVGSMKPSVLRRGATASGQTVGTRRPQQHDGRFHAGQRRFLLVADPAIAANDIQIARHQCEGLGIAPFSLPQPRNRLGIRRVAGELIAAQPLDRDDLALLQQAADGVDIVEHRMLVEADRRVRRSARARRAGRSHGRRWPRRESGGRPGRDIRRGRLRTGRRPAIVVCARS